MSTEYRLLDEHEMDHVSAICDGFSLKTVSVYVHWALFITIYQVSDLYLVSDTLRRGT